MNIRRIIRQVINEQILLTEGDSRINAVNRLIDEKFSDLPLNSVVSSSDYYVNGNPNTTWKEYILFNLRHTFGLMGNSDVKYLLPVARLAYSNEVGFDRRNDNGTEVGILRRIVQRMKKDDALFQQIKSNPDTTYTELYDRLRNEFKAEDDADAESADNVEVGNSDYDIIVVEDFNTAQYYGDFSCSSSKLCYTQDEGVWDGYKGNEDQNKCYLCLRHGWENIPEVVTEGNPYDAYGTSMIFVFIAPDGSIATSNCRWNHGNTGEYVGGTDHAFTKTMLAQTVGMPFSSVFKPYSEDELHSRGYVTFNDAEMMLQQGYGLEHIFDSANDALDGLTRVKLHDKYNFVTDNNTLLSNQWYDYASPFYDEEYDFSIVKQDGKYNFLNKNGNILCDRWFDILYWFRDDYATGILDGVRYKIDTDGNIYSDVSESKSKYNSDINRILELNNKLSGRFFLTESSKSHAAKRDTRIVIKNLFPDEDLEGEYVQGDARRLLHRTQGDLTWLDFYERYIYEHFFLTLSNKIDDSSVIRLEPAIARIAYGELNLAMLLDDGKSYENSTRLRLLKSMLGVIYDNVQGIGDGKDKLSINFIDGNYDLSGKSFNELYSIIGNIAKERCSDTSGQLTNIDIDSSRYQLISLGDSYHNPYIWKIGDKTGLNGSGALCYTQYEDTWYNDYINKNGKNKSYVLIRDDWDKLNGEDYIDDNNPYDDYGLSVVWFFVNEKGIMTTCNVRWNHQVDYPSNASVDYALKESDISKIMGESFDSVFNKSDILNIYDLVDNIYNASDVKERMKIVNDNMDEMYSFEDGSKMYIFKYTYNYYSGYNDDYDSDDDEYGKYFEGDILWLDNDFNMAMNSKINYVQEIGNGCCLIRVNQNLKNIVNSNGDILLKHFCIKVGKFSDGFCNFQAMDKKWYYVDENGRILNSEPFDIAHPFYQGYAKVTINGVSNIIDTNGNYMIEDNYGVHKVIYENGWCFVRYKNGLMKVLDRNFNEINNDWIRSILNIDNYGLAVVNVQNRGFSIMNRNGDYIVPFTERYIFGDGEYEVKNNKNASEYLLVRNGKLLLNKWLTAHTAFNCYGWAIVHSDSGAFSSNMINTEGLLASKDWFLFLNYGYSEYFSEPEIIRRKDGLYNLITEKGRLLYPVWFDLESKFNDYGLAVMKDQQGYNVITKYGDVLLPKGCQEVNLYGDRVDYKDANGKIYRYIKLPDFERV